MYLCMYVRMYVCRLACMHVDIYLFVYLFMFYLSTSISVSEPILPNVTVINSKFTGKLVQESGRGLLVEIRMERLKKST